MSFFSKLFGRKGDGPTDDEPFLEHPTGEFDSALEAITSALRRLNAGRYVDRWITFSGQGRGHDEESYQIENVPVRGNALDLRGQNIDLTAVLQFAGLEDGIAVETDSAGMITLPSATPVQMAKFLDAVFRRHFGIQPFEGEDDYAVGAEW